MIGKIINFKLFIISFFFIFFHQNVIKSIETKIVYKIDSEIITNIDIENEENYLKALNPNIKNLNKSEIVKISKDSILREKIKKIEIIKNFENPKIPEDFLEKLLKNVYSTIGITTLSDFKDYLLSKNINYNNVLNKIETEALWNELIVLKFSNKIKINEIKLREQAIKSVNKEIKSYLLSEIFFELDEDEKLDNKYKLISDTIINKGFNNAALKYSISETASIGGKLNWIDENSLNNKVKDLIKSKNKNEFTKPITVPGGFLILQVNDIKKIKSNKNIDEELKKLIRSSKNLQLNQYSKMYFNRIKEDLNINEI